MTLDSGAIRDWLFRGLATEARLAELEAAGIAIRASSDPGALQRVLPLEDFAEQIRKGAMQALPAYLALFCLENAVRDLVEQRLRDTHASSWWENAATTALKQKVKDRREKEGKNRWHIQRGASEIFYLDFGDLTTLITNNWPVFEDLFPDQNWITVRMSELEASRNIVAHSNTLDERELARIRMYLEDWLLQVG